MLLARRPEAGWGGPGPATSRHCPSPPPTDGRPRLPPRVRWGGSGSPQPPPQGPESQSGKARGRGESRGRGGGAGSLWPGDPRAGLSHPHTHRVPPRPVRWAAGAGSAGAGLNRWASRGRGRRRAGGEGGGQAGSAGIRSPWQQLGCAAAHCAEGPLLPLQGRPPPSNQQHRAPGKPARAPPRGPSFRRAGRG